jgi:hypothetical protein
VLEHVDDLAASVADMSRLVRPGGQLFVALPCGNPGSLEYWLASHVEHGRVATSGGWRFAFEGRSHLRRLRTDELIEAFGASGLLLGRAAFGNHFWGAIEWMCRGGRVYVDNVLDPGRGHNGVARLLLRAGRAVLRLIAADFARSRRLGLATGIERLTTREWRIRKSSPDGSAQYLVFTRPPP